MAALRENDLIARYFAPLARNAASFGLRDDAAWLRDGLANGLVVTTDASVAGVHFFADDDPADAAYKALAVNVSDLAAKGARPLAYLFTLALAQAPESAWTERLTAGLAEAQSAFGIALVGGDTVTARSAWWMSITALGEPGARGMVQRGAAKPGDAVYVSGSLGDAALGLRLRRDEAAQAWPLPQAEAEALLRRYLRPSPRLSLIPALRACASAAMDVSDGLALDFTRMCAASGVSGEIETVRFPLSQAAQAVLSRDPALLEAVIAGGDDYEILAAVAPRHCATFERLAAEAGVAVTRVGRVIEGSAPPVFLDAAGQPMALSSLGYQHF